MKALVIGGTGFIGSHIADALLGKCWEVRVTVRRRSDSTPRNPGNESGVEYMYGDVLDPDSLRKCLNGIDLVYTCFGLLGKWGVPERRYWQTNTDGLKNVLEAVPQGRIRQLIHLSSAGVLGPVANGVLADESFSLAPSNIYEKTKCEAENEIRRFAAVRGIPFTIIRPEFVYGPRDMHVLMLFRAIKRRRFFLIGSGESLLQPTYIDDLIQGVLLCTNNENALGKTFLITGRNPVSVKDLGTVIAEELGVPLQLIRIPGVVAYAAANMCEVLAKLTRYPAPILTRAQVKFFTENRAFSIEKAQSELGYSPNPDLRDGVRQTVHWYRDKGYL
jgi:nucleoside-diphosphate-sugar epimerase